MRQTPALFIAVLAFVSLAFAPPPTTKPDLSKEGIAKVLKQFPKDEDALTEFWRLTLDRKPTQVELERMVNYIQKNPKDRPSVYDDIIWAITNSVEYMRKQQPVDPTKPDKRVDPTKPQ